MVMQRIESPEQFKWCGFCFDCESVVVEDADFWFVIAISDLHADEHHHLVGVQTWVDRRIKKEAPKCSSV